MGSILLTLSVTIERYYSVCHPLSQFNVKRYLLPFSLAFSVVYNIPKFFELNLFQTESGDYTIVTTDLRRNKEYSLFYVFWSKFLLVEMLPYVVMIVLNILIYRRVKKLVKMRNEVGIETGEPLFPRCIQDKFATRRKKSSSQGKVRNDRNVNTLGLTWQALFH